MVDVITYRKYETGEILWFCCNTFIMESLQEARLNTGENGEELCRHLFQIHKNYWQILMSELSIIPAC